MNKRLRYYIAQVREVMIRYFPELLLCMIFLVLQLSHINIDFWNDEIYTLKKFTFCSFSTTVTDYHVPNNHILFNLINNCYIKLVGIESLYELFDSPWKLRIIPLVYSTITTLLLYRFCYRLFNRSIAVMSVLLMITSLPFFYFSLQIRGYGLSLLLAVSLVYSLLSYYKTRKSEHLVLLSVFTMLLLYTIPSNLYVLLPISLLLFYYGIIRHKIFLNALASIIVGGVLAVILYIPVLSDLLTNKYVHLNHFFDFYNLKHICRTIFVDLVKGHWLIAALFLFSIPFSFTKLIKYKTAVFIIVTISVLPFLVVWISGQQTPPRVFLFLLPVVAVSVGSSLYDASKKVFPMLKGNWFTVLMGVVTLTSFLIQRDIAKARVLEFIKTDGRPQGLCIQYYSEKYCPLEEMTKFNVLYQEKKLPIVIVDCEPHGIPNYLDKFDLPYHSEEKLDSLLSFSDSVYCITNHPFSLEGKKDIKVKFLSSRLSYHNVLLLSPPLKR